MIKILADWYTRRFSDPNAVTLLLLLVTGFVIIYFFGDLIAPVLAALVLAYLLELPVNLLMRLGCSRLLASSLVLLAFIGLMVLSLVGVVPTIFRQGVNLARDAPTMLANITDYVKQLPQAYPDLVDVSLVESLLSALQSRLLTTGEALVTASLNSLVNVVVLLVYLILVPLMVFFMLKDKPLLMGMVKRFLPSNRALAQQVWLEMNSQIINYVRGTVIHILIVGLVSFLVFAVMGINYALLLGVAVGFSVLIPYVGAVVVTVPLLLVGFFQWGLTADFFYLMVAYAVIQALDGNVLVPLLFSDAMNLHPIAIIVAVLVFGGLWGFWGVFFAIPLATLVKAVISAWSLAPAVPVAPESSKPV